MGRSVEWVFMEIKCLDDLNITKKRLIDGGKLATNYPGMHNMANGTMKVAWLFELHSNLVH